MKSYLNKIFSLKELALARVAISLCQDNGFKEVALQLERPTCNSVVDSPPCSMIDKVVVCRFTYHYPKFHAQDPKNPECHWNALIYNECQRLTEGIPLPDRLKKQIHPWIDRIALEYLCYSRKQETLFQVSRYFVMSLLTSKDWKGDGRLEEAKLALKLLEDEKLTVLQKYLIACVHCLHFYVSQFWEKLTENEKLLVIQGGGCHITGKWRSFVSSWSLFMDGKLEECELWSGVVSTAIFCGNRPAVMVCWKRLKKSMQQQVVTKWALEALYKWCTAKEPSYMPLSDMCDVKKFILPSYYGELTIFLLSQMDQEQQLAFLTIVAQSANAVACFLDWPYQDDFIPSITRLWGIISKYSYNLCLMSLAKKYSENYVTANYDYDYRSLLWTLWEETPEEYKNYVVCNRQKNPLPIQGRTLLSQLLSRSNIQEEDQRLFKRIFCDIPPETKKAMIFDLNDDIGYLCSHLILEGKWYFLTWLIQECIPHEEIASFRKKFISSFFGAKCCLDLLENNSDKLVDDLIYWCFEPTVDQSDVSVIDLCLSSVEKKKQFRLRFAECACVALLDNYASYDYKEYYLRKQIDKIIVWSIDVAEEQSKFKRDLFSRKGIETHFDLLFIRKKLERAKYFYEWFNLSPNEIKQLKWDTLFTPNAIEIITSELHVAMDQSLTRILSWCLTDEEMVMNFKNIVEEKYLKAEGQEKYLDELVSKLLHDIEKRRVLQKTSTEGVFADVKGGKRQSSAAVEDEPNLSKKQRPK